MKLQSSEIPLGKIQSRRRTPRIAPLLISFAVFLTFIPLYYPSLRYIRSPKKISDGTIASSFDPLEDSISTATLPSNPDPDPVGSVSEQSNNEQTLPSKPEPDSVVSVSKQSNPKEGDVANGVQEKVAEISLKEETESEVINKTAITEPAGLPSSTKSGEAMGQLLDKSTNNNRDETGTAAAAAAAAAAEDRKRVGSRKRSGRREKKRPNRRRREKGAARKSGNSGADDLKLIGKQEECDLFSGEWVPNPEGPYYTNSTCWAIQEHQNCMKFGRPDTGFLKWRWKPDGCELPVFEPSQFLEIVRGKSIAFVGDSVARNHMQSLICLLSKVAYPIDTSKVIDQNKRWVYEDYNFNISMFWSPYLVRTAKSDPDDVTKPFSLYLDEFDVDWTNNVGTYDYVFISAGHWFFRPTMFYVNRRLVGCQYCPQQNVTHLDSYFSYRRAFRTAFRAINSLGNDFKGVTFLRTFAPSHFEGGAWDKGGDCARTRPFKKGERAVDDYNLEMYKIQLEEVRIAQKEGRKRGRGHKFKVFDVTQSMMLRPDGHPSRYGHWPNQNVEMANDCVHWCLPGPIDSWNDLLLEMLKREEAAPDRSFES